VAAPRRLRKGKAASDDATTIEDHDETDPRRRAQVNRGARDNDDGTNTNEPRRRRRRQTRAATTQPLLCAAINRTVGSLFWGAGDSAANSRVPRRPWDMNAVSSFANHRGQRQPSLVKLVEFHSIHAQLLATAIASLVASQLRSRFATIGQIPVSSPGELRGRGPAAFTNAKPQDRRRARQDQLTSPLWANGPAKNWATTPCSCASTGKMNGSWFQSWGVGNNGNTARPTMSANVAARFMDRFRGPPGATNVSWVGGDPDIDTYKQADTAGPGVPRQPYVRHGRASTATTGGT
jgi:hypothetical protein